MLSCVIFSQRKEGEYNNMNENTSDLSKFGYREYGILADIFKALSERKVTPQFNAFFDDSAINIGFNSGSGCVYLTDSDYNCAMLNGDKLDLFISTSYGGYEGFLSDLVDECSDSWHNEDIEYLYSFIDYMSDEQKAKIDKIKLLNGVK